MSKTRPLGAVPHDRYWQKRVASKSFKRALTAVVTQELRSVSAERVRDVVDVELVRTVIREWDTRMLDREFVADLILQVSRRAGGRLGRRGKSLLGLLDRRLVADIDEILGEEMELSVHAEQLIAKMMRQEFVRGLFTDIIFTSIVSFYEKVNPLFGAITVRALEEQIRGFIRLFIPMVQQQATAFAINKENQRILFDFARAMTRQMLDEPLRHYAVMWSSGQRKKAEALARKALTDANLDSLVRRAAFAAWDDVYQAIRNKTVGDLLRLDEHAAWLAARSVEMILPAISRSSVIRFVATEFALAAAEQARGSLR